MHIGALTEPLPPFTTVQLRPRPGKTLVPVEYLWFGTNTQNFVDVADY